MKTEAILNWSSGKDSAMSLYRLNKDERYSIRYLLTTLNSADRGVYMHGVREPLLLQQSRCLNIPVKTLSLAEDVDVATYNRKIQEVLSSFRMTGINTAIFGDLFQNNLHACHEQQLQHCGMKAVFPLWEKDTTDLAQEIIDAGFRAIVTSVDANKLDKSFAGREINKSFLASLPKGVDPCGENGEFHSFVYDGPIFSRPVTFGKGQIFEKNHHPSRQFDENKQSNRFYCCELL